MKYSLYEHFVQSPKDHIEMYLKMYRNVFGCFPSRLREDFCGTFVLSTTWVERNRKNEAICIDLDPEPLAYGRINHLRKLTPAQKKRITVLKQNVQVPTTPRSDIAIAGNFSFFIFKERKELLTYLKAAKKSLRPGKGMLILEMAGGPGMIATARETKSFPRGKPKKMVYTWHQKSFDPISRNGKYAIHFTLYKGKKRISSIQNAFTYDWRLWTIPEVRELLEEAGFKDSVVFWETSHRGEGTGEYIRTEKGDNAFSWIAYIAGIV